MLSYTFIAQGSWIGEMGGAGEGWSQECTGFILFLRC